VYSVSYEKQELLTLLCHLGFTPVLLFFFVMVVLCIFLVFYVCFSFYLSSFCVLCPMLHVSLDCPFTFIFRFSKIQQNVMIIKYEQWRPSVEPHFNWIVEFGPYHFYGTFALWILHCKCTTGHFVNTELLPRKDEWRATYSVYNMNNTKHTSSTDKAEISFLKATFQFIQPNRPNMFKNDISVRTT